MNEAPEIKDYNAYTTRMDLSMIDKLFFLDKIQPDLIVDFGCANGTLMNTIHATDPKVRLVGYDLDARKYKYGTQNCSIFDDWGTIQNRIASSERPALILNSVIHEVFHYGSKADIDIFWKRVLESGFHYIVIRDMVPSRSVDRVSCINDVKKLYHKFLGTKALTDFERIWGSIENNRNLVHFLLKYRYLEPNWEREVRENYIPIAREDLLSKIPMGYDVIFHEHYVLPYILQTVRDEVGIELKDPTHLKLILRKH